MLSQYILAISVFLIFSFTQASTLPSFKDVITSHQNLSQFQNVLQNTYPDLLSLIDKQPSTAPITILAPTNAAFSKTTYYPILGPAFDKNDVGTIQSILSYHVLHGFHDSKSLLPQFQYFTTWLNNVTMSNVTGGQHVGGVMQSGTQMVWTSGLQSRSVVTEKDGMDIAFSGGVVHIVDTLLTPPTSFPATAERFSTSAEPFQLTSFLGATYSSLNKTIPDLAAYLNTTSDITIFAPNNIAMETVASDLASIAKGDPAAFTKLLQYHIVPKGPYFTPQLTNATTLQTVNGASLTATFAANSIFINNARIITPDIILQNGVMHVIDVVLSPDKAAVSPEPSLATQKPVLASNANFSTSEAPFTTFMPWNVVTSLPTQTTAAVGSASRYGLYSASPTVTGSGNACSTGCGKSSEASFKGFGSVLAWTIGMGGLGIMLMFG
jgi:transforming growth factor-beta-induced protein